MMQEKDTVLEVKNLYKLFGPYDFLDERKAAFKPISAAYRELKHYSLEQYIPLFIDYQTVYLSADNNLRYCEDIYKYDPSLLEAMNNLNLKP